MLKRFSSNTKKINRIVSQINLNNLSGSGYLDNILDDYRLQASLSASFDGRDENGNELPPAEAYQELSASLEYTYIPSFDTSTSTKSDSRTRSNANPTKLVNNKNKISDFYNEILQFGSRSIRKSIDEFSNSGYGSLTIYRSSLDYGTEGATPNNFEILVFGLHIPGDYRIYEQNGNVVVSLNDSYIDFDNVTIDDIYVIGKFK